MEWHLPDSPELNLLDLDIWMTLQSVVENVHRSKLVNCDLQAETLYKAFGSMDEAVLWNVYQCWLTVMDLVIQGKGLNDLVEQNRGMLRRNPMDDTDDNDLMELVALIDKLKVSNKLQHNGIMMMLPFQNYVVTIKLGKSFLFDIHLLEFFMLLSICSFLLEGEDRCLCTGSTYNGL